MVKKTDFLGEIICLPPFVLIQDTAFWHLQPQPPSPCPELSLTGFLYLCPTPHAHSPMRSLSVTSKKGHKSQDTLLFLLSSLFISGILCLFLHLTLIFLLTSFHIASQVFEFLFLPYFLQSVTLLIMLCHSFIVVTVKVDSITNQPG